jgi:hypothetical protein
MFVCELNVTRLKAQWRPCVKMHLISVTLKTKSFVNLSEIWAMSLVLIVSNNVSKTLTVFLRYMIG